MGAEAATISLLRPVLQMSYFTVFLPSAFALVELAPLPPGPGARLAS